MINGLLCEKWRLVQQIGEKTNKYTLWIRYKVRLKLFVCLLRSMSLSYYHSLIL